MPKGPISFVPSDLEPSAGEDFDQSRAAELIRKSAGRDNIKADRYTVNETARPRMVGINHIALEVGDVKEALAFYRRIFEFKLRGGDFEAPGTRPAFIDMGDQFIALMPGRTQKADEHRHFGLVVDDRSRVRQLAEAAGATMLDSPFFDFLDPWGNRVQIVEYRDLQFTKTDAVLKFMGLNLSKSEGAEAELREKGIEP